MRDRCCASEIDPLRIVIGLMRLRTCRGRLSRWRNRFLTHNCANDCDESACVRNRFLAHNCANDCDESACVKSAARPGID